MKFEDLKVDSTYKDNFAVRLVKILFKGSDYVLCQVEDKLPFVIPKGLRTYDQWVLTKPKKTLYCSVWTQKSGYTWTYSSIIKEDYDSVVRQYDNSVYTMIKQWELEYEDFSES